MPKYLVTLSYVAELEDETEAEKLRYQMEYQQREQMAQLLEDGDFEVDVLDGEFWYGGAVVTPLQVPSETFS